MALCLLDILFIFCVLFIYLQPLGDEDGQVLIVTGVVLAAVGLVIAGMCRRIACHGILCAG